MSVRPSAHPAGLARASTAQRVMESLTIVLFALMTFLVVVG
jgi:hypothetical protein